MSETLATCSRCSWTYTPQEHGPILALYRHWEETHGEELSPAPRAAECAVEGCGKTHYARGYCDLHYRRQRRLGTTVLPPRATGCTVEGCERTRYDRGLCYLHYTRQLLGLENPARKPEKGPANATHAG